MSLFQNSVLNKYLASQDHAQVNAAYGAFLTYFHHPIIRENIRHSKEEQFQEGFLRELFVKILGYTINPEPEYNLTTELKNIKDSKKTDGAILKDGKALAVIELKGTDTKDLEKIRDQAFNYKNNQPECVYVITSNFEKLRFYIHNAVDHHEFNILTMTLADFKLFWLFLHKDNLLKGIPLKIKEESLLAEERVTKQLYADYSAFKQELWQDMVSKNPGNDELLLYKKSQKLLDRFLFIFFAEDKGLLPPNSISEIVKQWDKLSEMDEYRPLYDRFKKYFGYMNSGRVQPGKAEIHAYNGGLFAPDEHLDNLLISDSLLKKHVSKLTEYDFESEVDTNILGHIFEHSLNDIENVRASLEGTEVDKSKTKRKKDGVFYTPKYITKYIVDNTVGKLCSEKKTELGIIDEEFAKGKAGRKKETLQKLLDQLKAYRSWLLQLAVCDPACGSGAFLNQVLEFLMAEHRYLDELESMLFGTSIVFPNVENHILENNIFGVDINEESVEIARLSLWLRTAQKGRKLSTLSSNIKVGNSLIDDPEVAGDLAFNWQAQFPQVFAKGGFDVVVGNPPYLRVQGLRTNFEFESKFYESNFESATGRFDIYVLFIEKAYSLISIEGKVSFILPHKFLVSDFGSGIRLFLAKNKAVELLLHFGSEMVFQDASTYTCVLTLGKKNLNMRYKQILPKELFDFLVFDEFDISSFSDNSWNLQDVKNSKLLEKLNSLKLKVNDIFKGVFQGVVSGDNKAFYLENCRKIDGYIKGFNHLLNIEIQIEEDICKRVANGKDIGRYYIKESNLYLIYPYIVEDGKTVLLKESELQKKFPKCFEYFNTIKDRLENRGSKNMSYPHWYSLWNFRNISIFETPKILTPDICFGGSMYFDNQGKYYFNDTSYGLILNESESENYYGWLGILNSKICWYYLSKTSSELRGGYFRFKTKYVLPFPLPIIPKDNFPFLNSISERISNERMICNDFQKSFLEFLEIKVGLFSPSTKLQNWPSLDFKGFLGELSKAKVKMSLSEEAEWMAYFTEQKGKALTLQSEITRLDREIDQLVYQLYELTEEEIRIVEGN